MWPSRRIAGRPLSVCSPLILMIAMIFTDVVMLGGMNGDELAEAAIAAKPDLKVLFTSGYAEPAVARLGAGAWLRKPYTAADLAQKIREILSQ